MTYSKLFCSICGFCHYYPVDAVPVICPECGANDQLFIDNERVR